MEKSQEIKELEHKIELHKQFMILRMGELLKQLWDMEEKLTIMYEKEK